MVVKKEVTKEQPNLFTTIAGSWNKHRNKSLAVIMVVSIFIMAVTIRHFENRFNHHLAMIQDVHQIEINKKIADQAYYEMQKNTDARVARAQVVSFKNDKFTIIHNADEDKFPLEYRNRLSDWAKDQGYDGIVFGRLQPLFDGGVKFATYSGKNEVSVDYVVEKLRLDGCKNVISVMSNRTKFWLPYPFTYQVNGDFRAYETGAISAAGFFNIIDKKIKFVGDNFNGTLKDGKMSVKLTDNKPWEFSIPTDIPQH